MATGGDKTQLLGSYAKDPQTRRLFASALDRAQQAQQRQMPTTTGFFTQEEQADFSALLDRWGPVDHRFLGGYPGAQRRLCYFPPPWQSLADMDDLAEVEEAAGLVAISGHCGGEVGHRDVLGSLMGLGLQRVKFGDILIQDQGCQVIVQGETGALLLSQWCQVGRYSLQLEEVALSALVVPEEQFQEVRCTLAGLRLDGVVAAAFSLSRSGASALITGGKVSLNHRDCQKTDRAVVAGDLLVCRGLGKCRLAEVQGQSKKGRTVVIFHRYG